jgi:hypothetical protein
LILEYLTEHRHRVGYSAGIVAVPVNFQFLGDFGLWRTSVMTGLMFVVVAVIVYIAILMIPLLGTSSRKSSAGVDEAYLISRPDPRADFQLHPSDAAWIESFKLIREALEIDPSNTYAAGALNGLSIGSRPTGETSMYGIPTPLYVNYEIPDLPNTYIDLMSKVRSDFDWSDVPGYPATPLRPKSRARRIRRYLATGVGELSATWIAGFVALIIIAPSFVISEISTVESPMSQTYRSVCESLLGDCGGKVGGFDRNDALDAIESVLSDRYPTRWATGDQDLGASCWAYVDHREVRISVSLRTFQVSFGYTGDLDEDSHFFETSRWIVEPPNGPLSGWYVDPYHSPDLPDLYSCHQEDPEVTTLPSLRST